MKAWVLLLVLLLVACGEEVKEIPNEVYDLREAGVNVLGIDRNYVETLVLYEPLGSEQDMIVDIGIIAGYMYQSGTFDKLKIQVERDETEIYSIIIARDDIEDYEYDQIDVNEFVSRWEFV